MTEEIWKTAVYDGIVYEGLYKISNLGRIKNINYRNTGRERLMNPVERKDGYLQVDLSKNKETKTCLVHRLVAFAFLENPENKPYINHKIEGDEGKKINMVIFNKDGTVNKEKTTIEWVTPKENNDYGTHKERAGKAISKALTNGIRSKRVLQLSLDGELIREWPSTKECERNGFSHQHIVACCNGKRKTHKGFRWKYEED